MVTSEKLEVGEVFLEEVAHREVFSIGGRFLSIIRWFLPMGSYQEVVFLEEVAHREEVWPL
jgi:hypothetical protein